MCRKSHYFNDGKVVWDSTGEGAKYVYRECKPLLVSMNVVKLCYSYRN